MAFKAYHLSASAELRAGLDEVAVRSALASGEGTLWVDISGTTDEDRDFLSRVFGFHPLAVEDCVSPRIHSPKIDPFADHLFIIAHGVDYVSESNAVETTEMALFLGPRYVVTNHNLPLFSVDAVRIQVERDGGPMLRGAVYLAHALLDALVDNVLPTLDKMEEVAEQIDEEVIRHPEQATVEAILHLKRSTVRLHRVMARQRDMFNRLSRGDYPLIPGDARIFYRNIYDHVVRIEDLNQSLRDMGDNALATHLSSVAIRQNEVMRIVSLVATIFMPLTLLAGIYGMNFDNMPELRWRWGYFAVLGFMGTVGMGALVWFWARHWLGWGRRRLSGVRLFAVEPEKLVGYLGHAARLPRGLRRGADRDHRH